MSDPSRETSDRKAGDMEHGVSSAGPGMQPFADGLTAGPVGWMLTERPPLGDASNIVPQPVAVRRSFQFSPQYRPALFWGLLLQVSLLILTAMVLDGGRLNRLCLLAIVGQWIGILLIMGRRPLSPTRADLLFIRWGIVPLVFVMPLLAGWVWLVIGESTRSGLDRLLSPP